MNGTNFAWAGSRSGLGTFEGIFPNLQLQIGNYSTQLANGNPALPAPATTLFTIWSGANDVFAHVDSGGVEGITPQNVANNISASITSLYGDGGRYFLVPNLPQIGDTPLYIDDPIKRASANAFVDSYNGLLSSSLDALSGSLAGITIIKLDINQLFLDITANPGLYDFTNVTDTAYIRFGDQPYQPRDPPYGTVVANPDGYFYWDATHGTALANSLIGDAAYQAVTAVPEPSTYAIGIVGLLAFTIWRKTRRAC
jgi:outer membrane lipase/esterase